MQELFKILPWGAVLLLSSGYFMQAWKIHVHKEVRDLSIASYIMMAVATSILLMKAIDEGIAVFIFKQSMVLLPCIIIIVQIIIHKRDKWED
jgi:uncharacterized protein with PQ loop repeat